MSAALHGRIMAAAERLGYRANLAARALVSRRSGLIGVVIETLADPQTAGVVEALERSFGAAGYGTLIVSQAAEDRASQATDALLRRGAEAVVFANGRPLPAEIDLMRARRLPWACVADAPTAGPLAIDDGRRRGGALAARYLYDLGHRAFGVLARSGAGTREGVVSALAMGDTVLTADAASGGDGAAAAQTAVRALLDQASPPTAIVCGSDGEALAAVRECLRRGVAVPGTVSIVGFGDWESARHAMPGLTTLRIAAAAIGARAAEVLVASLAEGQPAALVEVPVKLVVRESTGPPPA